MDESSSLLLNRPVKVPPVNQVVSRREGIAGILGYDSNLSGFLSSKHPTAKKSKDMSGFESVGKRKGQEKETRLNDEFYNLKA